MDAFEKYLQGYCEELKIDRETALQHAVVKEVGKYYENAEKGKISVTEVNAGCGAATIGGDCK